MKEEKKYIKKIKELFSNMWYVVALVAVCTAVIMLIANWNLTLAALGRLVKILMPFILGFLFAYLIDPFVRLFVRLFDHIKKGQGMKLKKVFGMILSYLIVVGVIVYLIIYITPEITQSVKEIGGTVQRGYNQLKNDPDGILGQIPFINAEEILGKIKDSIDDIIMNLGTKVFPYLYEISTSVMVVVYDIIIGLIISIYMVWSKRDIARGLRRILLAILPKKHTKNVWETLLDCNRIFNGFLVGKMIDSLIIGVLSLIIMMILRMPYAVLLSAIVGITNMIPYFGPLIGAVPGIVIYLFIDPRLSLGYAILILALQQFDGWVLGPKILGDQVGIKPLSVILGVTVGGAYFGVLGMFLGVPAVAVLWYLGEKFIVNKLKEKKIIDPKLLRIQAQDQKNNTMIESENQKSDD